MLARLLLVLSVSISYALANEPEYTAIQWLEKMSQAMKSLNYQGTVAIVKNGRLDSMKYFHQSNNGQEKERLLSLNSPIRDVIRDSGKVRCFLKDSQTIIVNHRPSSESFILNLPASFSILSDTYNISLGKEELVATHPVQVISIEAKDNYRYSRKIWVDTQYFLPLKMEIYDLSGVAVEQVVFTEIQVGLPAGLINVEAELENIKMEHIHQSDFFPIEQSDIILENLPEGFRVAFFTRMNMGKSEQSVDHLLLSDGFSSISVYKEIKTNYAPTGFQVLGVINSFTHLVKNYQITVMGEVPAQTVQFVAQGIRFH
ncbi:MAG: MucB/RseB C-terminal domain-containing protein [Methylococcaceae bacterium]|nr:MucB/RseB C-terminal domain-containing protein [Methylococcaceae bacterium]